jgi:molybdopterin synthase sulfur carrier subunit
VSPPTATVPTTRCNGNPDGGRDTCRLVAVPTMRLFASAREAAGTGTDTFDGATVSDVLAAAEQRYGATFSHVLSSCRIWVNGNAANADMPVGPTDEVAVLPPVSGGST